MFWITNKLEYDRHQALIDQFFRLYEHPSNFPDPDERENPLYIRERIESGSDSPHTHLLMLENEDGTQVIAGAIVEFYPDSQCALLTYLFVDEGQRGKGLAQKILHGEEGLRKGLGLFKNLYSKDTLAVFFESNNPEKTERGEDSMDPKVRLAFFKKAGAKILGIPYVQPPLDETKMPVTNLYLLTFPALCGLVDSIPTEVFLRFYREFCVSLNAGEAFTTKETESIKQYIQNQSFIQLLPI